MHITRAINEPVREGLSWEALWKSEDDGLIACWERGRQKAAESPDLAAMAAAGNLLLLPWKGGHEKATKIGWRYGTLNYLAMWQGLRGDPLSIETDKEVSLTCSATGMRTTFTADAKKFANSVE